MIHALTPSSSSLTTTTTDTSLTMPIPSSTTNPSSLNPTTTYLPDASRVHSTQPLLTSRNDETTISACTPARPSEVTKCTASTRVVPPPPPKKPSSWTTHAKDLYRKPYSDVNVVQTHRLPKTSKRMKTHTVPACVLQQRRSTRSLCRVLIFNSEEDENNSEMEVVHDQGQ
ncbi:hypothetical protein C9374_006859 [Naegleria lovaniensis]|uniref:Uncharacterized protein n=1 Tax=Naegleria lovaniensis TaxID=51637 RepID=A0AA88H2E4_NAELO|nr:uncharacterized protein C9374_006859 [Naegleria lovaniensis]KAG2393328.1 hypothetical protein C9374_006859 [Naegleria lovaniensis]